MIDHIVNFKDEAEAKADPVIGAYWIERETVAAWRGDVTIPGLSVFRVAGTHWVTPPDGSFPPYKEENHVAHPGWFILIALPELSPEIRDLPQNHCFIIADRTAAANGEQDFVIFQAHNLPDPVRQKTRAEPCFAGVAYPFYYEPLT